MFYIDGVPGKRYRKAEKGGTVKILRNFVVPLEFFPNICYTIIVVKIK
jgi:hypothetical protein